MAPLSRPAVLSLTALTIHYCVLSIVLHISRTAPGRRYHASSAIFLTELGKIIVSWGIVLCTGELRGAVQERKRLRALWTLRDIEEREREEDEARWRKAEEEQERVWKEVKQASASEAEKAADEGYSDATVVPVTLHRRTSSEVKTSPISPTRTGPGSSLCINVALAQATASSSSKPPAPSLAFIPATPAPYPSPVRTPDESALYPERHFNGRTATLASASILDDVFELEWWRTLWASVFGEGVWKLAVLAALFCFQGNAQYVASGNLSVPLFQLAYQLKIPATAMCSVILLNRALTRQQWAALFVLTFGVGLVQLFSVTSSPSVQAAAAAAASASAAANANSSSSLDAFAVHHDGGPNQALGLAAVVAACMSSGFASVYFERILKIASTPSTATSPDPSRESSHALSPTLPSSRQLLLPEYQESQSPSLPSPDSIVPFGTPSLWIRNIQLSMFGLAVGFPVVLWEMRGCLGALDYEYLDQGIWSRAEYITRTALGGFFDGFDRALPWVVVFLQLTGGLLSALVMQHADNLLKCFSTSLSILLSVAASVILFSFHVTLGIFVGAILVLGATFAYTSPSKDWRWRPVPGR
ncbi:UDP-galactose transporter [Rhodotorula toruloides]|uniref:UDP-galactose transporter n=1 Tax=Rhodotorula toruloides TaxID=5286 RepID=A0A511KNW7_RHOTO|nr:UDP-galactose transporter [Rhodotorula toruloides]